MNDDAMAPFQEILFHCQSVFSGEQNTVTRRHRVILDQKWLMAINLLTVSAPYRSHLWFPVYKTDG
jgi:hypothetical protein